MFWHPKNLSAPSWASPFLKTLKNSTSSTVLICKLNRSEPDSFISPMHSRRQYFSALIIWGPGARQLRTAPIGQPKDIISTSQSGNVYPALPWLLPETLKGSALSLLLYVLTPGRSPHAALWGVPCLLSLRPVSIIILFSWASPVSILVAASDWPSHKRTQNRLP